MTFTSALEERLECEGLAGSTVVGTEDSCRLEVEAVGVEDGGEYQCVVGVMEGTTFHQAEAAMVVQVAQQASLELGGVGEEEVWTLQADQPAQFSCGAEGGVPAAQVSALLGPQEQLDTWADTELGGGAGQFSLTPTREDCGKYVKCKAQQVDDNGDVFFGGPQLMFKKVMR